MKFTVRDDPDFGGYTIDDPSPADVRTGWRPIPYFHTDKRETADAVAKILNSAYLSGVKEGIQK
jgi:hypothetical protein